MFQTTLFLTMRVIIVEIRADRWRTIRSVILHRRGHRHRCRCIRVGCSSEWANVRRRGIAVASVGWQLSDVGGVRWSEACLARERGWWLVGWLVGGVRKIVLLLFVGPSLVHSRSRSRALSLVRPQKRDTEEERRHATCDSDRGG